MPIAVRLAGRRAVLALESLDGAVAGEEDVAVGQRPVATAGARQFGTEHVAVARLRVAGGVDVRHDWTVQYAEAVVDRVVHCRDVVHPLKPVQVRCKDAHPGAVPRVDDGIALKQVDDGRVRAAVG